MNLVVDAGNTFVKIGIFNSDKLEQFYKLDYYSDLENELSIIKSKFPIQNSAISSVINHDFNLVVNSIFPQTVSFNYQSKFPFKIVYKTPETIGVDRLINLSSAFYSSFGKPFLVIDLGSCITYDFVNKFNVFEGGGISPGLNMRLKAMHKFTAKLPLVEYFSEKPILKGDSTQNCIKSGVWYGILGEINYLIQRYEEENPELQVFLTGGDALSFVDDIKSKIFARPNLMLEGLNRLIQINAK